MIHETLKILKLEYLEYRYLKFHFCEHQLELTQGIRVSQHTIELFVFNKLKLLCFTH